MPLDHTERMGRAEELNSIGAKFFREGHLEPARLHFLAALSLEPEQAQVLQNLGAVLRSLNHYDAAESVAKRSVVASGNNPFCRSNLGVTQLGLKKYKEAVETLKSVVKDLPTSGPSWHNYGLVLYMVGRYQDALEAFDKAITLNYFTAQVKSDRALTLLALGKIQEGLEAYECRWELLAKNKIWNTDIPEWQGESLLGRRILVHHEQGFGDSIMLSRFINILTKLECKITFAVPTELVLLFQRSFHWINVVDAADEVLFNSTAFDFHAPLLSVMRWLGIREPKDIDARPYLYSDPMNQPCQWPDRTFNIGICWASGNHTKALLDRRRLVPITSFLPMSEILGVGLISLQKGEDSKDIVANGMEGIIFDLAHRLDNFAITADVISRLHLVISVDSAVAHLAAAIGKPCLMLSPYTKCWRWWNNTSGWPWYERMSVFRQGQNGTWTEAMRHVNKIVENVVRGLK